MQSPLMRAFVRLPFTTLVIGWLGSASLSGASAAPLEDSVQDEPPGENVPPPASPVETLEPAARPGPASESTAAPAGEAPEPAGDPAQGLEPPDSIGDEPPGEAWDEADAQRLTTIRDEVRAMQTIHRVLSWYAGTQGEESYITESYRGRETLLSSETLQFIDRALARPNLDPDEARALEYLKHYLAVEYIELRIAPFDDRIANAVGATRIRLPWKREPVRYRDLERLAAGERSAGRRAEMQTAAAQVWAETLNPLLAEKEAQMRTLAVEAGYPSYVALSEVLRGVDLKTLIPQAAEFLQESDGLYREMLDRQARDLLGKPGAQVTRADLEYLSHAPAWMRFFPKGLELEAFRHFLDGMGLSLTSAAGPPIQLDDADRPDKMPDALCVPVRVPRDIRLSVKPGGGLEAFTRLFHEGGHALHHANTMTTVFEFQQLGSRATTEAWAELFRMAWDDPHWLKRYRRFVQRYNLTHPRARIPLLTDRDIARIVRHRVFWDLHDLRRFAFARLVYEAVLHGAPSETYRTIYPGPTDDLQAVYRELFSRAYGFELSSEEALRYRIDVDDLFLSADFARAFLLSHRMHEALRARLGPDWYGEKRAGELLKSLWHDGSRLTAEELARQLGEERLSFGPVKARLERLLKEAAELEAPRR